MKIEQEFVTELFCVLRLSDGVFQIVREISRDRLDEDAEANPIKAVVLENLQTGRSVRAVAKNFSALLGLSEKRQIRAKGEIRGGGFDREECRERKDSADEFFHFFNRSSSLIAPVVFQRRSTV
jgi:hypothetical protein